MDLMQQIVSDEVLQEALQWLCRKREDNSTNSDLWDLQWRWEYIRSQLQQRLRDKKFRLSPTRRCIIKGKRIELWAAQDALIQNTVAIVLSQRLFLSNRRFRVRGHRRVRMAVREVVKHAGGLSLAGTG